MRLLLVTVAAVLCVGLPQQVTGALVMQQKLAAGRQVAIRNVQLAADHIRTPLHDSENSFGGLVCYNCTYSLIDGVETGSSGCNDPFGGVAKNKTCGFLEECVKATATSKHDDSLFIITRGCLSPCENYHNLDGYYKKDGRLVTINQGCCTNRLCNGTPFLYTTTTISVTLFSLLIAFFF